MLRPLHALLLLLILVNLVWWVLDCRTLLSLRRETQRLEKIVGHLEIHNPTLLHLVLLERKSRDHLLWRVFLPENHRWRLSYKIASGSSGWSSVGQSEEYDSLYRVRFHEESDRVGLHILRDNGSSESTLEPKLARFLQTHWDELQVDIAGSEGQTVRPVDGVVDLFSIRVPQELMPQAQAELGEFTYKSLQTQPLLQILIGTEKAFESQAKPEGGSHAGEAL